MIPLSAPGDDHSSPITPPERHKGKPEAPLTPDIPLPRNNEEEDLSVGSSVECSKPVAPSSLTHKDNTDPKSDTAKLGSGMDSLVPVFDTGALSGESSNAGSNVSLEILEIDESLTVPQVAADDSSYSSQEVEESFEDLDGNGSNNLNELDARGRGGGEGEKEGKRGGDEGVVISGGVKGGGGGVQEMSWWAEAVAETDNMVENDLDALVDRIDQQGESSNSSSSKSPAQKLSRILGKGWHSGYECASLKFYRKKNEIKGNIEIDYIFAFVCI